MTTIQELDAPALGGHGEPCPACGTPLARDQRYCLNCGQRRGDRRVPLSTLLPPPPAAPAAPRGPARTVWNRPLEMGPAAVGVGLLLLVLLAGVLIGRGSGEPKQVVAAAQKPQVITVAPSAGTAAAAQPKAKFTSDWPAGKHGYTVRLKALPKDGTDVAAVDAAKSQAEGKGAADVGALDSDDYESLDPGSYIVYSGVFKKRNEADRALAGLKKRFPGAKVIKVSDTAGATKAKKVDKRSLRDLEKLSPKEYQKKSRKLPDKLKLPGKPPPKDNKKAGGGGKEQVIG